MAWHVAMTDAFVRLSDYRNPRDKTAGELHRVEDALREAGVSAEIDRGATDEGHPWVTFARPGDGEIIAHAAVIDGQVVIDSPAFTRPLWGRDMGPLLAKLLERLRLTGTSSSPLSLALLAAAVALAAAHMSDRDADGWSPIEVDNLPAATEAIGIMPALMVVRAAQAAQAAHATEAATEQPQFLAEEPVELARNPESAGSPPTQSVDASATDARPEPMTRAMAPAQPVEFLQTRAPAPTVDIPSLLRKGDTVELVIGRGADAAAQLVASAVQKAPDAWFDPREAAYEKFRGETMASIARGDLVGSDVTTALGATEAYIRAQRAGVTKVELDGNDVTLYTAWNEPTQIYQFIDQSSITLVGVGSASPDAE
jgi:hypothetical protein